MAMQALTPSRRNFLSGSAAVAAVASLPIAGRAAAPSLAAWDAALDRLAAEHAKFDIVQETFDRTERAYWALLPKQTITEIFKPKLRAEEKKYKKSVEQAMRQTGHTEAAQAQTIARRALDDAMVAILICPAPDIAAAVYKLDLAIREEILIRNEDMERLDLEPLRADLHRLAFG